MGQITLSKPCKIINFVFLLILSFCLNISISLSQIALGVLLLCLIIYLIDNKYNIFIKDILDDLGSITGEIATDEIIDEIFAKFCLGK